MLWAEYAGAEVPTKQGHQGTEAGEGTESQSTWNIQSLISPTPSQSITFDRLERKQMGRISDGKLSGLFIIQ